MDTSQFIPCPFCGGTDLVIDQLWFAHEGEINMAECLDCHGQAPATIWNYRSPMAEVAEIMESMK